ncbi:MAG: MBL fold metallo-hydrolase [Candidatus Limiplasma sp.]|nr:MBL fold metallo-hydrolase [Candidatus Limiplasma sp.]
MKLCDGLWLVGSGALGVGISAPYDCNVYLLDAGGTYAMIDAGAGPEPAQIRENIVRDGIAPPKVSALLLTHHHSDHAGAAAAWKRDTGLMVYAPADEAASIETGDEAALGLNVAKAAGFYPGDYVFTPCAIDRKVRTGDRFIVGDLTFRVLDGAGHSLGGVCYACRIGGNEAMFTGDLLSFGGRISLQNIPGVSVKRYAQSVLALEGEHVDCFLPGHGLFSLSDGGEHVRRAAAAFRSLGVPPNAI